MSLKTNYKNDKFSGKRKYKVTTLPTGEVNLDDTTEYAETGDIFNADDINATNKAVNAAYDGITKMKKMILINIPVSGWSDAAPFMQSVPIAGITELSVPVVGMQYPEGINDAEKTQIDKSFGMITDVETLSEAVMISCRFKKPTADLLLCLKGE